MTGPLLQPRRALRTRVDVALGVGLALIVIASALVLAAANPAVRGPAFVVVTGVVIGVISLGVAIAASVLRRLRLPDNNDEWGYW